ncbi:unnamed protein product, partial [marine sediment metagenome]
NGSATLGLFLPNNDCQGELGFYREDQQNIPGTNRHVRVDLYVKCNNNPLLIIENKVKDFATNEQLSTIISAFEEYNPTYLLTTLFHFDGLEYENWEILTYEGIGNTFNEVDLNEFQDMNGNNYSDIIAYYRTFLQDLASLAEHLPITNNYDFIKDFNNDQLFDLLNSIKMWEAYQRMRASHLVHNYQIPYDNIITKVSVNHKKATIDFEYPLNDNYSIGVQLEGSQFRRFIKGSEREQFADNLMHINLFFNDNLQLLGYKPNFHYQKYPITENVPYVKLYDQINNILNCIHVHIEELMAQIP